MALITTETDYVKRLVRIKMRHSIWIHVRFTFYTIQPHVSVWVRKKTMTRYIFFGTAYVCQPKFVIQINEQGLVGSSEWKCFLLVTFLVLLIWWRRICWPFILMEDTFLGWKRILCRSVFFSNFQVWETHQLGNIYEGTWVFRFLFLLCG